MADGGLLSISSTLVASLADPLDDLGSYMLFREVRGYLFDAIDQFAVDLLGRTFAWVGVAACTFFTLWILIQGYCIISGRSRDSMTAMTGDALRGVVIVAFASGMSLGGMNLYEWFTDGLSQEVGRVIAGESGDLYESIDRNLALTQVAVSSLDAIDAGDDPLIEADKIRSMWTAGLGISMPAMVVGALLLMYRVAMTLVIGFGPLFVLALLFDKTKPLFERWLFYGLGTLFSLAVLNVMAGITLNMVAAVAATFWLANTKWVGANPEGLSSLAMQQGGLGALMTVLLISTPAMAARFFKGTLGEFLPFSVFGSGGAARRSVGHAPHPQAQARAYADTGERAEAPVQTHAHRVAASARTAALEDKIKPAEKPRSFLERYPNATASLDKHGDVGSPLPKDLQGMIEPEKLIPKGEPDIIYVASYNPINGAFKEISKGENRKELDGVVTKLNFAGQVLKDHNEQEAIENFNKMRVIVSSVDSGAHSAYIVPGTKDMVVNLPRFVTKGHDQVIGIFLHEIRHLSKHNIELRNEDIETNKEDCCHPTKSQAEDDAYKYQEELGYPKK